MMYLKYGSRSFPLSLPDPGSNVVDDEDRMR
jgi:hypothetical protein